MKVGIISPYNLETPCLKKVSDTLFYLMTGSGCVWECPNQVISFGSKEFKNCIQQFSNLIIFCKYEDSEDIILKDNISSPRSASSPRSPYGSPYGSPRTPRLDNSTGSPRLSGRKNSPRKDRLTKILDTCSHIIVFCKTGVEPETLMSLRRNTGETIVYKINEWS